jgi:hypothetical protein
MRGLGRGTGAAAGAAAGGSSGSKLGGMLMDIGSSVFGGLFQRGSNKKNMKRQYNYQRMLNQQGHDLQYDMWNKTNYPAQLEMMKKAGLNPGLMYGLGGGGGTTTGSQGGGAAAGGQAPMTPMGIDATTLAQIENIKANTEKTIAEKDKLTGADTDKVLQDILESKENVENLKVARNEMESRITLNEAQADLVESGIGLNKAQEAQVRENIEKIKVDTELQKKILELDYTDITGRNVYANMEKLFSGQYDLSTYVGAASAIFSLATLKNPMILGKLIPKARIGFKTAASQKTIGKLYGQAVNWFKKTFGK